MTQQIINPETYLHTRLGCKTSICDIDKDYLYHDRFAQVINFPDIIDVRPQMPSLVDQGNLGDCVGNSAQRANGALLKREGLPHFDLSRLGLYYDVRGVEHTIQSDAGMSIRDMCAYLCKYGAGAESLWPYNVDAFRQKPPPAYYADRKHHIDKQWLRITNGALGVKTALMSGLPVLMGFPVYSNFYNIGADGIMPKPAGTLDGGHCVCIEMWDGRTNGFWCGNNWSKWGKNGYFFMSSAILQKYAFDLYILEKA